DRPPTLRTETSDPRERGTTRGWGRRDLPDAPTPWHARAQVPVAERFSASVLRITRRGGPSVRATRVRAAGPTRAAVRGTGGANTTAGRTGAVTAGVRGTRGLVEVDLAEHSRGRVPTAEAEGQGRCRGTAYDHCAEGEVDDRVGQPHIAQAHGDEQCDRRVAQHLRREAVRDELADERGDEEAGGDDRGSEQDAAAEVEDLVEDVRDLGEAEHPRGHDREEDHDRDLDDPRDHVRGARALGHDADLVDGLVGADALEDLLEQI